MGIRPARPAGAATAGAVLIAGFAIGPFAGGLIAGAGDSGVEASFALAAVLVVIAMALMVVAAPARGAVGLDRAKQTVAARLFGQPRIELGDAVGAVGVRLGDAGIHHHPRAGAHRARGTGRRGHRRADRQRGKRGHSAHRPPRLLGPASRHCRRGAGCAGLCAHRGGSADDDTHRWRCRCCWFWAPRPASPCARACSTSKPQRHNMSGAG